MNPLTTMEIKLCQAQAKIFENSVSKTNYSSLIFIRRFMYSTIAKSMDKRVYLYQSDSITDALNTINEEFGESSYGKIKYSEDQMYWIGYIYRCISIDLDTYHRINPSNFFQSIGHFLLLVLLIYRRQKSRHQLVDTYIN